MSGVFSSRDQLEKIKLILSRYIRLPFSLHTIPGAFMEAVLAHVRDAVVLRTYDFIDVYKSDERVGWSIKSTMEATPVTWKRAKIPNQEKLIANSLRSSKGLQELGNAVIEFCNSHAFNSMSLYKLKEIGYARLIIFPDGSVRYFERSLCTVKNPEIFRAEDFSWVWSIQKASSKKEQLSALHGIHKSTGKKWWAWHGLGENQLHFSGEREWWPPETSPHTIAFRFPTAGEKISLDGVA